MIDHYKVLQVTRNASLEVIQAAFLARNQSIQKEFANDSKKLQLISLILLNAYNTLSDPEKRRQHDVQLTIEETKENINTALVASKISANQESNSFDARIEPNFNPNHIISTISSEGPERKSKSNSISHRKIFFAIFLLTFGTAAYLYSSPVKNYIIGSGFFKSLDETINSENNKKGQNSLSENKSIGKNNEPNKTTEKRQSAKYTESSTKSEETSRSNPQSKAAKDDILKQQEEAREQQRRLEELQAQNQKVEQERIRAIEIERAQMLAAQKLRCDKAKLHYTNSQNRINSVRSSYQNRIDEIEKEIQGTAFASLALAFKDKRALSEGANMNRPKEELQRQIRSRMNHEVSILETELEQFRISNLECFR